MQQSDVQPHEAKPSTLTQLKEGAKDIYRRLSGKKKGEYTQLPTADPDFKTTLESSKSGFQKQGTYAILPQEDRVFTIFSSYRFSSSSGTQYSITMR